MESNARDKILQTARQLIEAYGYNNLKINDITEKAGVAIGTFYWHFKQGKSSIVKELAREGARNLNLFLKKIKIEPDNPIKGFKPFFLKYIEFHRKSRSQLIALETESMINPEIAAEFEEILKTEMLGTVEFIENILKKSNIALKDLSEKLKISTILFDDLVHRHVIFDDRYGSDDFFADLLVSFFDTILTK
ncbi:MAG: TetR/AcrR family transcriptional regulator [Promethearchaeota archaeon]